MLCIYNTYKHHWSDRALFYQIHELRTEHRRLGLVLSLLLPPALIPVKWRLVSDDDKEPGDGPQSEQEGGDGGGAGLFIAGEERFAESHPSASVLFAEIKQNDKDLSPKARMRLLDSIFLAFDDLVAEAGAVKIETIAGVYVVAANVAGQVDAHHAATLSRLALRFASVVPQLAESFPSNKSPLPTMGAQRVECLLGIDSGAVIGGVIGKLLPRYRIFGDTVNTAARLETSSEPGRVQVRGPASSSPSSLSLSLSLKLSLKLSR